MTSYSGYTCVRSIFFWLNILLLLTGCCLIGVGSWIHISYEGYVSLLPQYALLNIDYLFLIIGVIIVAFTVFGCCGSLFENRCMLLTYFSCLFLIFEIELCFGILAFIFRNYLSNMLQFELQNGIKYHYNNNGTNNLATIWDRIHVEFQCCGVVNAADWYYINSWPNNTWVPDSCCLNSTENCGRLLTPDFWYKQGCAYQVHLWFFERLYLIGIIGLGVAFVQFFGLISSMLLFCIVKRDHSYTYRSFNPTL